MTTIAIAGYDVPAYDLSPPAFETVSKEVSSVQREVGRKLTAAVSRHEDTVVGSLRPSARTAMAAVTGVAESVRWQVRVLVLNGIAFTGLPLAFGALVWIADGDRPRLASQFTVAMAAFSVAIALAVVHVFLRIRKGSMAHDGPLPGTALSRIDAAGMVAGEKRLYCTSSEIVAGVDGKRLYCTSSQIVVGVDVKAVLYEAAGRCFQERGDLVLTDRQGVEISRVPGVCEAEAAAFSAIVNARIAAR